MSDTMRPRNRVVGPTGLMPVLTEWWEELNWPRIFGAARQGLRPGRLGLAFFALVACVLLLGAGRWLDGKWFPGGPVWSGPSAPFAAEPLLHVWRTAVDTPVAMVRGYPLTVLVAAPLALAIWLAAMAAICRMTACELCLRKSIGWTEGLGFAVRRWRSLIAAMLAPPIIVWGIAAALAVAGWALLHIAWLNLVGAAVYPLFLLAGLIAVVVAVGYALCGVLFTPAIACEGTDAIDAVQRGYTYLFARPLRMVWYLACSAAGLVLVAGILTVIVLWSIGFAARGGSFWAGTDGSNTVWRGTLEAVNALPTWPMGVAGTDPATGPWGAGAWLIHFWTVIPVILVIGAWASCAAASATAVYLGMRKICDGQDWAELWVPGMIPGTMAQTMDARAKIATAAGVPQPEVEQAEDE